MHKENGQYSVYDNPITRSQSRKADRWRKFFARKFNYDPDEKYILGVKDNQYLGELFGLKDILQIDDGEPIDPENGVIISTIPQGSENIHQIVVSY